MNFALPAIIFFLLILPGFAFRSRLQVIEGTKVDYSPFGHVVTEGVIWAGLLHALMLLLSYLSFDKAVRFDVVLRLLSSRATAYDFDILVRDAGWVAGYFAGILGLSIGLATLFKYLVTQYRLDRADCKVSALFRFRRAPWYYLLSGADFSKKAKPDLIQIAAVVSLDAQSYIYQGILEHYYTDEHGQLDRLVISQASRRPLQNDAWKVTGHKEQKISDETKTLHRRRKADTTPRFYPILGDYFVMHYDEIATLNVRYIKFDVQTLKMSGEVLLTGWP